MFLADDHPAVRSALRDAIEEEKGMGVCGEAAASREALRQIEGLGPEVAIVDLSLEDAHGLDLLENLQAFAPETEALIYSMFDEEAYAERSIRTGASGYIQKSTAPEDIVEAIRAVAQGKIYLSQRMTSQVLKKVTGRAPSESNRPGEDFTDRELMVFQMIGLGYSRREIQERLSLARKTVETYRRRAKKKLDCDSISDLYRRAVQWTDGQASLPTRREASARQGALTS